MSSRSRLALVHVVATALTQAGGLALVALITASSTSEFGSGAIIELFLYWYGQFALPPLLVWIVIVLLGVAVRRRPPSIPWLVLASVVAWMAAGIFWTANELASEVVGSSVDTGIGMLVVIIAILYGTSLPVAALIVAAVLWFTPSAKGVRRRKSSPAKRRSR